LKNDSLDVSKNIRLFLSGLLKTTFTLFSKFPLGTLADIFFKFFYLSTSLEKGTFNSKDIAQQVFVYLLSLYEERMKSIHSGWKLLSPAF
jgi:hypothetical protein